MHNIFFFVSDRNFHCDPSTNQSISNLFLRNYRMDICEHRSIRNDRRGTTGKTTRRMEKVNDSFLHNYMKSLV